MAKDSTKDMTVGSPMKLILGFSIPLLFGALFQQFYSVVDTVIVGRFLGVNALAGVGATGSLNFMIMGFCMGVCSGFAIPVAHKFGAKDYSGMRQVVANSVWLSVAFSVVMTTAVALLCRNILTWMKTPEDIFEYSYAYILIIFLGIPATYLYNILSGVIRSMGDSKTPLFFLTLSSVLNIGLDILFIVAFEMGVAGAAAATVISQLISGLLCLFYMVKKFEILHITRQEWRMNPMHMRQLCGMGLPMGLQYSITAIGSVILQTSVNTLGALAVASVTAEVMGNTGMESGELVRAVCEKIKPACVVAVDALASRSLKRLCKTVQIADTGITPGSGVGNHRMGLTRDTLGVPVIALGVPTVVDGATLAADLLGADEPPDLNEGRDLLVTPKDIDSQVDDLSKVIGYGISMALQPGISLEELELLLS